MEGAMEVTSWGNTYEVSIRKEQYANNGGLALKMDYFDDEYKCWMPFATLTVNLGRLNYGLAYVDTNNCPWAEEFITKYGIGEPTEKTCVSGWCEYPLYRFDIDKIDEVAA